MTKVVGTVITYTGEAFPSEGSLIASTPLEHGLKKCRLTVQAVRGPYYLCVSNRSEAEYAVPRDTVDKAQHDEDVARAENEGMV